jgi:hypothetical protein
VKLVDLNILLYVVNEDSRHHRPLRAWWEEALSGDESIGLPWLVLLGFLRIVTNARVFPRPLSPDAAARAIDEWLSAGNTCLVTAKDNHWQTLRALVVDAGAAGNLVTDAHLAALAISHGAVLVSCDNDFARFKGLRWENPLTL